MPTAAADRPRQPGQNPLCEQAVAHFMALQDRICTAFEAIEQGATFTETLWQKTPEDLTRGGGRMRLMRGRVFEKVGVNFSRVWGQFSPQFAKEMPGADGEGHFWASGISLVAHMANPLVPAVHMNLRRIETTRGWFGGGADLTPAIEFAEDTQDFHAALKAACDSYSATAYATYKKACDDYFFLPHRGEARGVGGIFVEGLASDDVQKDFAFIRAIGEAFLQVYPDIVKRRMNMPCTEAQKALQKQKRGRYVEFNLLYDRGTRFGLMTGGNTEAILMSLPPEVTW